MNKLEQINQDLLAGLQEYSYFDLVDTTEFSAERTLIAYLATLVELGDYALRLDYWNGTPGLKNGVCPLDAHNEFIALAKRVATLVMDHGRRPYDDVP